MTQTEDVWRANRHHLHMRGFLRRRCVDGPSAPRRGDAVPVSAAASEPLADVPAPALRSENRGTDPADGKARGARNLTLGDARMIGEHTITLTTGPITIGDRTMIASTHTWGGSHDHRTGDDASRDFDQHRRGTRIAADVFIAAPA